MADEIDKSRPTKSARTADDLSAEREAEIIAKIEREDDELSAAMAGRETPSMRMMEAALAHFNAHGLKEN
jgi:hypothetical protein